MSKSLPENFVFSRKWFHLVDQTIQSELLSQWKEASNCHLKIVLFECVISDWELCSIPVWIDSLKSPKRIQHLIEHIFNGIESLVQMSLMVMEWSYFWWSMVGILLCTSILQWALCMNSTSSCGYSYYPPPLRRIYVTVCNVQNLVLMSM